MCDDKRTTRIAVLGIGSCGSQISQHLTDLLMGKGYECHPLDVDQLEDYEITMRELELSIAVAFRQSFREAYKERIDRYQRKWPRRGCTLLPWNRKVKWQPRFFSGPSRRLHFSQSQLRLSQVLSWRQPLPGRLRRDSSRGLLSHS
ncbi:hypothetical protein D3C75_327480 [compost metagenome]